VAELDTLSLLKVVASAEAVDNKDRLPDVPEMVAPISSVGWTLGLLWR